MGKLELLHRRYSATRSDEDSFEWKPRAARGFHSKNAA